MRYFVAIASRYGAIVIQFAIVVLVARSLTLSDAGIYFIAFSLVATLFPLAGLGMPDGMVKAVGLAIATNQDGSVLPSVKRAALYTGLTTICCGLIGMLAASFAGVEFFLSFAIACWWALYCSVFFFSQLLVALHKPGPGAFFGYTATNFAYLVSLIPYLFIVHNPTVLQTLWIAVLGSAISALFAGLYSVRALAPYISSSDVTNPSPMFRVGFSLAASRLFQASLAWTPIWTTAYILGPEASAVYSAGGRLMVGVTAVVASLRFAVRPEIIKKAALADWRAIERLGRIISLGSTGLAVVALAGVLIFGPFVIPLVFGPDYVQAVPVLAVLLIGAIGEGIGGPVDEVLKMTGYQQFVLMTVVVAALSIVLLSVTFSQGGVVAVAAAPAIVFCVMYASQVRFLYKKTGALLGPLLPRN
ncbi:lipopolysaccharide biosynthesis protein [Devosia sp. Leaf64]|uniref:lipopolysaccharide biosynthesis protein n=1 Tax=Devosia sp. Leaf64 TaxID=1736229 RepID=UPI0007131592|nr:lipopolysaccharide biosynthesis protein [Devosia sp. Leaf64]KQN74786.1 hypothetical protein ASE94_00115 [Devosia sp. Leaf64]